MMTKALRSHALSRSAPKVGQKRTAANTPKPPSMATVERRLAALSAADMPWLREDVDLTPPDGGPEVCGPAVAPRYSKGQSAGSTVSKISGASGVARQTVPLNKTGIGKLPDDKPVVYTIAAESGRVMYTGVATRGHVQERLQEHLPQGRYPVPGSKVRVEQMSTIGAAREKERAIIAQSKPKYNADYK